MQKTPNSTRCGQRMVMALEHLRWSSYPYFSGALAAPDWLDTEWLLGQFEVSRAGAFVCYREFVLAGRGLPNPLLETRHPLLLGVVRILLNAIFMKSRPRRCGRCRRRIAAQSPSPLQITSRTTRSGMRRWHGRIYRARIRWQRLHCSLPCIT